MAARPLTPRSRRMSLRLTVWRDGDAAWHARAEWGRPGRRAQQTFDSPFELARFMAQLLQPGPEGCLGGLR